MGFSIPKHLKKHFAAGRKFLVVANDAKLFLAEENAVFQNEGDGPVQFHIIDLERLWGLFLQILVGKTTLNEGDLRWVARVRKSVLTEWIEKGVIGGPDEDGVFSAVDGFTAALCGALVRKKVPFQVVRRACRFVREGRGELVRK